MEVVLSLNYIMDAEKDNFLKWVLLEFFINFDGKMESWTDQNAYQDDVEVDWWIGEKYLFWINWSAWRMIVVVMKRTTNLMTNFK